MAGMFNARCSIEQIIQHSSASEFAPKSQHQLITASPNAAVDNRLIYKKHDGAVRYHTNEMRAKTAVQAAEALLPNDCLGAVNYTAVVSKARASVMNSKRSRGLKCILCAVLLP